jgi:ribosome-associated toxin RatA of RatAB toxin-antitoxin module
LTLCQIIVSSAQETDETLVIKNEKQKDGKKCIKATFSLNADPDLVYNTLCNVEKFPEFMPGSSKVKILEKGENYQVVKFSGKKGILSADIIMKRIIDKKNRKINWNLVDGPMRNVSGYWLVEKDKKNDSLTVVHYSNHVDAGILLPGFMVRKHLHEDIKRMVPNIRKRVESRGTWISEEYRKTE